MKKIKRKHNHIRSRMKRGRKNEKRVTAVGDARDVQTLDDLPSFLRDAAYHVNEQTSDDWKRLWLIRTVFAFGYDAGGQVRTNRKQVGVFVFRPHAVTASESEEILSLKPNLQPEAIKDVRSMSQRMVSRDLFYLENPGPSGNPRINRNRLINFLLKIWSKAPIRTNGYMEFVYDHIELRCTRDMLLNPAAREKVFRHVADIIELMDSEFVYDPWAGEAGALRRVDEKGIGPWSAKR